MRYQLREIPLLLRTPLGRKQLMHGVQIRTTPFFYHAAKIHRKTLIRNTRLIATVGSFGKTTTTQCIKTALSGHTHRHSGGNSGISLYRNVLGIRPRDREGVLEVGINGKGQMAAYASLLRPDVTVVTCIGSEHNRSLGTLETTRQEKAAMVQALGSKGLAVLNGDDPNVRWMARHTSAPVITYGFQRQNHFRASGFALNWPSGSRFTLHMNGKKQAVTTRLMGRHMIYPALAAIAVATHEGRPLEEILTSLASVPPAPNRLHPVHLANGAILLEDQFKSTLETVVEALNVMAQIPARRKLVVMGEISEPQGPQGPIYKAVGRQIASAASNAYFLCTRKSFKTYRSGAAAAGMPKDRLQNSGRDGILDVIDILKNELKSGDVVLIKARNSQRLHRLTLALTGRPVGCNLGFCDALSCHCADCPMLESGWEGKQVLF